MKAKPKIAAYVRVSTSGKKADKRDEFRQTTKSQRLAIRQWAENSHIPPSEIVWYEDRQTGKTMERKALTRLLKHVQDGKVDCVVVFDLSRFARNLLEGLQVLADLAKRIRVVSVSENIDFGNSTGMLIAQIMLALAEWQRKNIVEKVKLGLAARKAEGKPLGRPQNTERLQQIRKWYDEGMPVAEICQRLNCSPQNTYKALKKTKEQAA